MKSTNSILKNFDKRLLEERAEQLNGRLQFFDGKVEDEIVKIQDKRLRKKIRKRVSSLYDKTWCELHTIEQILNIY